MHVTNPIVLVIDDSIDSHKQMAHLLRDFQPTIRHAFCGVEGLEIAVNSPPDLILLDYDMPEINGLEVLKKLRENPSLAMTPVIFITSSVSTELVSMALAGGATDFIRKPLLAPEFQARVRASLESHAFLKELSHRARFDSLTELPNRWSMVQHIERVLEHQRFAENQTFALFHINFDRFRLINENLGRDIGDRLLVEVATRIKRIVASSSFGQKEGGSKENGSKKSTQPMASRLEGDHFMIMVEGLTGNADITKIAGNILLSISDCYVIGNQSVYIDSSIGIVIGNRSYGSAEEMLCDANTAMHHAKISGRHRFQIFNESMREQSQRRLNLNNDLRRAIEKREFELLYQPLLRLSTGQTASVEALIRWNHESRGVISPIDFIPFAEETGLILDIGDWCTYTACEQLARWMKDTPLFAPKEININIARQQLIQPSFVDDLKHVFEETGVSGDAIHLEITESDIMTDTNTAIEVMTELRNLGVKMDIDDFGTGHSSLACLNKFPIDVLKLDRSIIAGITERGFAATLVEFVLGLAKASAVSVVAEGIETSAQEAALIAGGCEFGQGYLFSKPLPANQIPLFIQKNIRSVGKIKPRRITPLAHHN